MSKIDTSPAALLEMAQLHEDGGGGSAGEETAEMLRALAAEKEAEEQTENEARLQRTEAFLAAKRAARAAGRPEPTIMNWVPPVEAPAGWRLVPVEASEWVSMAIVMDRMELNQVDWDALLAAAPQPPAASQWRTIESAPKSGTAFWAHSPDFVDPDFNPTGCIECAFDGDGFVGCVWNGQQDAWFGKSVQPTHWMPFPEGPEA